MWKLPCRLSVGHLNLSSLSADIQNLQPSYTHKTAEAKLCDVESALSFITGKKKEPSEHNTKRQHSGDYWHNGSGILTEVRYECSLNYWNWSKKHS